MTQDLVSIILASYNNSKYLIKCLSCITNQTYKNIEIICVDDASTDNSRELLKKYSQKDSRIHLIFSAYNEGVGPTRQKGLLASSGQYVLFVDADDEIEPWTIEHALKLFTPSVDVVWFGVKVLEETEDGIRRGDEAYYQIRKKGVKTLFPNEILNFSINIWNKMFRRSDLIEQIKKGYEFKERFYEDAGILLKFFATPRTVAFFNEKNYRYFHRPNSIMRQTQARKTGVAIHHIFIMDEVYRFWFENKIILKDPIAFQNIFANYVWLAYKLSPCEEKDIVLTEARKRLDDWDMGTIEQPLLADIKSGHFPYEDLTEKSNFKKLHGVPKLKGLQKIFCIRNENGHLVCRIGTVKIFSHYRH